MTKGRKKVSVMKNNASLSTVINALERVKACDFVSNSDFFYNDFNRLIERLNDDSFRLAVVGEFSSGKSTFLNALIGQDLLKHGAKETTATVTEIYNDPDCTDEPVIDVFFNDGTVKKGISSSEITEVTATSSQKHSVAYEIDKVSIRSNILDTNAKVCFVDTPGLNGIADRHREKTIEQIKNAHACIYLLQVRGLGQSDVEFLKYICKYQHNIIFVQNFIDELKKLEGETPEEKIAEQKRIIEEKIVSNNPDIKYTIVPASARKALISRADEFTTYNEEELTEEIRERLYDESKFDEVLNCINDLMVQNEKDRIQQKDTLMVAIELLNQLRNVITFEKEKEHEEWESSSDGIQNRNYKKLYEILNNNHSVYIQKLNDFIESETSDIRKECTREINTGVERIEVKLRDILSPIESIDGFERYVAESLPNYLFSEISEIEDISNSRLNVRFENLICNAVLRIKQYTGSQAAEINIGELELKSELGIIELKSFEREEDEITKLQKDIFEKKRIDERLHGEAEKKIREIDDIDDSLEANNQNIRRNRISKESEISQLGAMPGREQKYRTETYYEYRGGLGILDKIFGPKECTRRVSYYDDSNQQRWLKKKSDIETKYRDNENQYSAQRRVLEEKKRQCDEELKHIEKSEVARKKEIHTMESLLAAKTENLAVQREKAKQEYLREAKKTVIENVREYLCENVQGLLIDNFVIAIMENKDRVTELIESLFELSYGERIASLNALISDGDENAQFSKTNKLINIIDNASKELEEYLCCH